MAYSDSIHGSWCNTRTYPMTCRYCRNRVFYFSCDHGSKIFFDELGPPWPRHLCEEYQASLGSPSSPKTPEMPTTIQLAATLMRPKRDHTAFDVEPSYMRKMREHSEAEKQNRRGEVRMDPPPSQGLEDMGQVRDFAEKIDIYKQLDLPKSSPMSHAFLGDLAKEPMARIVLHVDDPEQDDYESYSCYIPRRLLNSAGVIRGDVVNFSIKPVEVPGKGRFWLCIELEPPFKW
ncbi:MAG TPA: hypothetical protein VFI27_05455 [candidate division Zixibacteria bacterium]|nr:hypothetical protein [candidate division Zixibacteria bacterium]